MFKKVPFTKSFIKSFFVVVIPVMLSQLITNFVNIIDNIMVGGYSNAAVSAVFTANQVTFVFNIMIFGIVGGAGIFVAQFFGANDRIRLQQAFHFKIYSVLLVLLIGIPLLIIFKKDLARLFLETDKDSEIILSETVKYFDIVIFSFIPFSLTVVLSTTLREIGQTRMPLIASVVSLLINVLVNSLLINGVLKLGVVGAALATLCARIFEFLSIFILVQVKKYAFFQNFWRLRIEWSLTKKIAITSAPFVINELLWALAMTLLTSLYSKTGDEILSALSITNTATEVFTIIFTGFASGIGVFVGHKLGEGQVEDAKLNADRLMILALAMGLACCLLLVGLGFVLPLFYREVSQVQKILATQLIIVYGSMVVFYTINCTVINILKAGGRTITAFLIDSGSYWGLTVLVAFLLVTFTDWALPFVYLATLSTEIIKSFITIFVYRKKSYWARDIVGSYEKAV